MHIRVGANVLMYSVLVYSSTYFGVLRCTLYSCTLGMMYSVLVLEYIKKVLVLSEYISQYFSINNAIILILMIYLYCSY